jgi:hypothetical protein
LYSQYCSIDCIIDSIEVEEEKERVETSTSSFRIFFDDRTELRSMVLPLPGGPQRTTGGGSSDDDEDDDDSNELSFDVGVVTAEAIKSSSILACLIVSIVGTTSDDSKTDAESIVRVGTLLAHCDHSPFSSEKSKSKRL